MVPGTSIFDVAANFNSPTNSKASSAFSYLLGHSPDATAALDHSTQDCFDPLTYCYDNNNSPTSQVTWNNTGSDLGYYTIIQPSNMLRLDPQNSVGTIVRFTAPFSGMFSVNGLFQGIDIGQNATLVSVFANGVQEGSTGIISTFGASGASQFSFDANLTGGQAIDFVVTTATESGANLSTGLEATITGTPADAAATPEPGSLGLMLLGVPAFALVRRFKP